MSSETATSTHASNKAQYGNTTPLTYLNYEAWKDTVFLVLRTVDANDSITGAEADRSRPEGLQEACF